jgi:hypothetical protein
MASGNLLRVVNQPIKGGTNIYAFKESGEGVGFYSVASSVELPHGDVYLQASAGGRSFLRHEHVGADDKGHKGGDDRADRKDFPVALIDEHAKEFLKVDPDLVDPSGILQIFS